MSSFYKILKADPMDGTYTPNKPGAKPIQSYWCQVEGQEQPVMIGKQVRDDGQPALRAGQHVYGDLMFAKSQKGTQYWKFKSAQVPEGVQRPTDDPGTPAQAVAQQSTGVATGAANVPVDMSARMPNWAYMLTNQLNELKDMVEGYGDMHTKMLEMLSGDKSEPKMEQVAGDPIDEETQAILDDVFNKEEPEEA